jgi:hypothetical protein
MKIKKREIKCENQINSDDKNTSKIKFTLSGINI